MVNYSKSTATYLADCKHMSNADSDMNTYLAYIDCSDAHPFEVLTQLVPLVQTLKDEPNLISPPPRDF